MQCEVCNGTGYIPIGEGIRGIKKCENCGGLGEVSIYKNGTCKNCGAPIPTYDFIPENDVKYCYYCGAKIERQPKKTRYVFEFETDVDWVPGKSGCWTGCPFSFLIGMGNNCKCLNGSFTCPFINIKETKSGGVANE